MAPFAPGKLLRLAPCTGMARNILVPLEWQGFSMVMHRWITDKLVLLALVLPRQISSIRAGQLSRVSAMTLVLLVAGTLDVGAPARAQTANAVTRCPVTRSGQLLGDLRG